MVNGGLVAAYLFMVATPIMLVVKFGVEYLMLARWSGLPKLVSLAETIMLTGAFFVVLLLLFGAADRIDHLDPPWIAETIQNMMLIPIPYQAGYGRLALALLTFSSLNIGTTIGFWHWREVGMPRGNWQTAVLLHTSSTLALGSLHLAIAWWFSTQ